MQRALETRALLTCAKGRRGEKSFFFVGFCLRCESEFIKEFFVFGVADDHTVSVAVKAIFAIAHFIV